ncbi:LysR family transcriptional regulator [Delftia sp. CH05]|uniref:LysR family transcriptional regulator n=1 Tax=Delftia sp. CH05 TaxID=2692194 RepID=UPI00135ED0DB|nr:LysR family transcriptional regulator [Delftia sp. CH05]MXN30901.1 LysR family transcriptional regulator [Delftia sp. CH05]
MNISLRQLRAFLAVAESRNFSRAGELMALTQPAVSRNVTELEQALGVQLLHRTTREVELTDAGRLLQGHATRVLDALDECLLEVSGLATQRLGKVRVASSPTLSAHLMPRCIARCREQAPGIELLLLDRIQSDVLQSVRSGEVDFGVVIDPQGRDDLYCETILSEPFCLVCPATHRLARKRQVAWSDLAGQPLVLLDHASGSRRLIDAALQAHDAEAAVVQEVGHTTTIFCMLQAGLGLSVVPELAVPQAWRAPASGAPTPDALASRPLLPRVQRDIMLVRRRQRELSPVAQSVWDLIRAEAARL